ncbi:proton-conducting transporter membrane subunit [Halostella sp. PRR32]|uniref:complex I subunit 5 family protein n=1 Tax=Halostella sp. PRR32 TaxID=3098147 RepID=UPI002B1E618B|nr:proton-conducting transporter membrane subunit [Halostella sp. PRR32]
MTDQLVTAPVLVALVSIVLTLSLRRWPRLQRAASVAGGVGYAVAVALVAWGVVLAPNAPGAVAYQIGGWPAPFGITLVADALSAFMLVVAASVGLPAVVLSVLFIDVDNQRVFYHPLFHSLLLGIAGAFLTGDLFNLFVWFEVMLMASYVLVAFYSGAQHTAAAFRYLVLNVIGGVFLLLAVGGLYATTGTLNMADMAQRLADPGAYGIDPAPVFGLSALLFAAFALKAGLVPFQFWVPGAYRAAPLPVSAMLAGASKKVGIYAIIRLYFTVFSGTSASASVPWIADGSPLSVLAPGLLIMGVASVLVGALGAVSRDTIEGMLAYSSIGQVGFIAVPVAIAAGAGSEELRHLGIVAALVYALHHALAKGLLFFSAAAVRSATGTNRMAELSGLASRSPALAGAFFVGSLSLVGVPPLTGFFGKFLVFATAADGYAADPAVGSGAVLLVLLLGALLTILYTTRAWVGSFWGPKTPSVEAATVDRGQVAVLVAVAAAIILLGIGFDPVYRFASAAADAAVDTNGYVDVVDPAGGDGS